MPASLILLAYSQGNETMKKKSALHKEGSLGKYGIAKQCAGALHFGEKASEKTGSSTIERELFKKEKLIYC